MTPKRSAAVAASRQTTSVARLPMCFSSQTTSPTPALAKWANASSGCSRIPSRREAAQGLIVGGR